MPAKLTKRTVDAAKPGDRDLWLWDSELRGFGLRVRPSGAKSYVVEYRPGAGGRSAPKRRYTIGRHGSPYSPDSARSEADRVLRMVKEGKDPAAERIEARRSEGDTVGELADAFIKKYAKRRQRSWRETERIFQREIKPALGKMSIETVTRRDIVRRIDAIAERGPIMANRVLAACRKFFGWCIERGYIEANPCAGVKPPGEVKQRDRVLTDVELVEVWNAAKALGEPFGPMVQLLLLTAQRRNEVAAMQWSEVDLEGRTWTIPAERAKNGRAHEVPLTDTAIQLLEGITRRQDCPYVFSTTGKTPVSGFSKAKCTLDALIASARAEQASDGEAEVMPAWTFHDLRRTATTGMARLGIHPHVADAVLNHKSGTVSGVAAVYNRHAYLDERRRALESWEAHLLGLLSGSRSPTTSST